MEQQQFKVSFSLGTKLLMSIVLLLIIVIVFLNVSTVFILADDKKAYVFQNQSTESILAGRVFANYVRHSVDTLRFSLSSVDPKQPPSPQQTNALQSVVDNQSDLLVCSVALVNLTTGQVKPHTSVLGKSQPKDDPLTLADFALTPEILQPVLGQLQKNSFALVNATRAGGYPLVGILLADVRMKDNPGGTPVGFGVISLKDYADGLRGVNLTVATLNGQVLYDSDLKAIYDHVQVTDDALFDLARKSTLTNGALEFEKAGEKYLGSYVLPGYQLVVLNKTEWKKAKESVYLLGEKFIFLGLLSIGAAVIFAIYFSKTLTSPINRLYEASREVAKGNFDLDLKATGTDEIAALTSSFNVMSKKISELIHESVAKANIDNELLIASTVQQTLIPPPHFENENILIESHYQAASQCGGDWWGFFGVGKRVSVMIADATGHGFPSALITASARSCFSVMQKLSQDDAEFSFSPAAMLSYANRVVFDASLGRIMMTFFVGVIDFETGIITYANAGHNPPWLFRKEQSGYKQKSLTSEGRRLGEVRDYADFEEKEVPFGPGDTLFLYTDGLTEGSNLAGEMFGKKKVRALVESQLWEGPKFIIETLTREFQAHNKGKPLDDDVTFAAMSFR
jgi:serine phosphatase RsbU (regulator of sigma subunit)